MDWSCHLWRFTISFSPGAPCTTLLWGPCPLRRGLCLDLLTWPTLKNFLFVTGTWQDRTAGRLTNGCWVVQLQAWHPWLILKPSLILRDDIARGPCSFAVAVPNQFRCGLGTGIWLSYTHSSQTAYWETSIVWLIISQMEQLVTQWNAILIQLFNGSTIYRPVSLFLYIKFQSEL